MSSLTPPIEFTWSDSALNVIHQFHSADIMVYVEGKDDINFWEGVFERVSSLKVKFEDLGGAEEVNKRVEKIISGQVNALVARDSDLSKLNDTNIKHPLVLYTNGYSIENSLVSPEAITSIIKKQGKMPFCTVAEQRNYSWFERFCQNIKKLIYLDIYNHVSSSGYDIFPKSPHVFFKDKSCEICSEKIKLYIDCKLKKYSISRSEFRKIKDEYSDYEKLSNWLRGHFLLAACRKYIECVLKSEKSSTQLRTDSFYTMLLLFFESNFNESHPDYPYYKNQINDVESFLRQSKQF